MTKVTFYNGLREIGGTFVAVETERAKCMFDFGFAVADRMDPAVKLRGEDCAADYVRLGVLAAEDGIYGKRTARKLGLAAYGETGKECFFVISHMHIDHMGGLGLLDSDIPVYMSRDSLTLYRRLAANGEAEVREHKNCIGVAYGEPFTVGDIRVTAVPVDHDVIGACGFRIETADGSICYTGDYRFHGFHPEKTEGFAQAMKGSDLLITEGVTVSFEDVDMLSLQAPTEVMRTEYSLAKELGTLAREKTGLIVINPYNRNVERIHYLLHALRQEGRLLVLDSRQADYVHAFYPDNELSVYRETAQSEAPYARMVGRQELLAAPEKYVLQLDYSDLYELMDLQPVVCVYVHMDGSPLGDYDPSFAKLGAVLERLNIPYEYRSLGGHSSPWYLKHMIDTIAPGTLIPLHSFRPEQIVSKQAGQRILPEYGETILLENGRAVRMSGKKPQK